MLYKLITLEEYNQLIIKLEGIILKGEVAYLIDHKGFIKQDKRLVPKHWFNKVIN